MKKIGILTYHRSINYGAFLQAYALATHLQRELPATVEIVDYNTAKTDRKYKKKIYQLSRYPLNIPRLLLQYRSFQRAAARLPLSPDRFVTDEHETVFRYLADRYDVAVVGSDAIWNWKARGFPNAYMLSPELPCVKCSYAASAHNFNYEAVPAQEQEYFREALATYAYIGVRDVMTERMVAALAPSVTCHHNCDPTMLLAMDTDTDALRAKLARRYRLDLRRPLIGLMAESNEIGRRVREQYGGTHTIVALYCDNQYCDRFLYDLDPFEWAQVFSLFDLTVTSFFHPTILSLKNLVPTISFEMSATYARAHVGKIQDVLGRLGMSRSFFIYDDLKTDADWRRCWAVGDELIAAPPRDAIAAAIEREAACADSFVDRVRQEVG